MKKRKSNKKGIKGYLITMFTLTLIVVVVKCVVPQFLVEDEVTKQVKMAQRDNFEIKKQLLLSDNLTGEALIVICEDASDYFNLKGEMVQKWFIQAIDNTDLTEEQQKRLAMIQDIQPILLMTSSLTSEELMVIAENMNPELKTARYFNLWQDAVKRVDITIKEREKLSQEGVISKVDSVITSRP